MVDRVSASITVGGTLPAADLHEFLELIADEDLSLEWDGEAFDVSQLVEGTALRLMAHEVAQGEFGRLEDFCVARSLPFRRWSDGCGSWGPERVVHDGTGLVSHFDIDEGGDEGGRVMIDRATVEHLGSMEAVFAWFDLADPTILPLLIGAPSGEARHG